MTEQAKPREFWLNKEYINDKYEFYSCEIASRKPNTEVYEESDFKDAIHVIEYSAYKQLEAENERLFKVNLEVITESPVYQLSKQLEQENASLKSRIENLKHSLEYYADTEHYEKCVNVSLPPSVKNRITSDIEGERGARARAALKADEEAQK